MRETKRCPKCGEVQPIGAFNQDKSNIDGCQYSCRRCRQEYVVASKEARAASNKRYRVANKGILAAKRSKYYAANKETLVAKQKIHYEANKGTRTTYAKKYREENQEALVAKRRARREVNVAYLSSLRPLKCESCGYDKSFAALDFHHTDPGQKEHNKDSMGRWLIFSLKGFQAKIQSVGFTILCANCHRELHANETRSI